MIHDFWCHVFKCATEGISRLGSISLDAPTEIANLNDVSIFDQDVFGLDIAMDQTLFVHKVDSRAYLDEEVECSVFSQALFFPDEVEEVTFASILKGQVDDFLVFEACVESANILVIQLLLDSNFPNQRLLDFAASQR